MRPAATITLTVAVALFGLASARADDGLGLKRGGDPRAVSVSGLSSGAAMAVQYAVAHSSTVTGVGSVAGPLWGCAEGSASRAVNTCMCGGGNALPATATSLATATALAASGRVDPLAAGRPAALRQSYVFQSPADATVKPASGARNAAFLGAFVGAAPTVDRGEAGDRSDQAGHGILSPAGDDACVVAGAAVEGSYVRRCGTGDAAADNAGHIFQTLLGAPQGGRVADIPASEVWAFDQRGLIAAVTARNAPVAYDGYGRWWWFLRDRTARRDDLDMAAQGYLYVPPACRAAGSACRVHVALHGCKQDPRVFALEAGYNNWAAAYRTIVVYPALAAGTPNSVPACALPLNPGVDLLTIGPNPNGCWDWWGYLDVDVPGAHGRYLTQEAPQMRVLTAIIDAVTAPR